MLNGKPQSIITLSWRSACGFSKFSKRQTTPKILRDHRFTRQGMVMRKQKKDYTIDFNAMPLSQAHQEHLFYNKTQDMKLLRKQADEREQNIMNKHVFEDHSVLETILLEIQDKFLIDNHPRQTLNNLMEIEKKFEVFSHKVKGDELCELVQNGLTKLVEGQIRSFGLRDFGVLVTLCRKYLPFESNIWEDLANNFCRLLQNNEYHEHKILDASRSQKQIDNIVMTLTNVLKFANKHNHEESIESLADAATAYLSSNMDIVQDVNSRFLLVANVLPLLSSRKQIPMMQYLKKNIDSVHQLQATTLTALTHSVYKVHKQNMGNPKFPTTLIDSALLQKIEQAWLKKFDQKNVNILAIFAYSISSLRYEGESKMFIQKYLAKHVNEIVDLKNLAFLGESLKKFGALNQNFFDATEKVLKISIANQNMSKNNDLTPDLALQFLRISSKKLFFGSEVINALIKQLDQAFFYKEFRPRPQQTEMIVKTLQKYSQVVDLSNLRMYQTLIGSKKIL